MSAADWISVTVDVRGNAGVKLDLDAACWCGKRMKHQRADREGFYCRKHGLQAYIDKITRHE